jgi:hypothetical protein
MGPKSLIIIEGEGIINAKGLISSPNTMITSQCENTNQDTNTAKKERKRWNLNKENGNTK